MNLPTQYGPYLLLERVSVGGMAEVYKAKEYGVEGFERTVAVKRILPHVAEDDEFIAMFKDEAKIAVQLNHGNIAQIYNLGNEQDSFYIALEYVAGRDLRAIFQRAQQMGQPMPVAQACYIIMKICEGLDYAHNKKDKYNRPLSIVHRDVSPPNILVSFEGEVKLIDFGVAKAAGRASRTQAGILKGKFGYMSPEQVRGMPLDRRSDVFSVGVVLFEILVGQRLFQAETDFATLEKVRAVDVPRPTQVNPNIPKPLENIIFKALTREPEQRYQSAIELHDELQAFMFAQGLFYSRKDLAAWMRENYHREIEQEKEKAAAQADLRPEQFKPNGRGKATGGGRPPPPPSGGRPPPPPPGGRAAGPPAPPGADGKKAPKRKTMVMTTSRNLPPPPGGKPKPPGRAAEPPIDPPTIPVGSLINKPAIELPKPKGASKPKAKATSNYAATPGSDFDWDDDELETRLFDDDGKEAGKDDDAGTDSSVPTKVELGARPMPSALPMPAPAPAPMAASADAAPDKGMTMVPGDMMAPQAMQAMQAQAMQAQAHPAHQIPGGGMPAAPGMMGMGAPGMQPQMPGQGPMAPGFGNQGSMPGFPMAPGMMGGAPGMVPSGAGPAMPPPPGMGFDYDDRPRKSNVGPIVIIVLALLVLFGAAFGGIYVMLKDKGGKGGGSVAEDGGGKDGDGKGTAMGALSIQVTPTDAKVAVDGKELSGASPFVTSVSPGKHKIKITHDTHLDFETEVDVPDAGLNVPPIALQPKAVKLSFELVPAEATASVMSGDQVIGTGTNGGQLPVVRKPDVAYEVQVSAPGYTSLRQPITFTGEPTQVVKVTLVKGAEVVAKADPPPETNDGGSSSSSTKKKRGGGSRPKPTAAKTATLRIGTKPGVPPAKVTVDGKSVGTTPLMKVMVTPGKHTIKFTWAGRAPATETVSVGDGQTATVKGG
ncbi:serine/threonine-protein kinase [Paraliomyxa miuraensis]|uniref:serine/threonine-protein kinase n=1 Tax=Paraliomyxa miuraensis TaxID=376150 RepID=UPI0022559F32|nr:serine/threonine-protein kinase [Paraliomyxa miuraensis]MCX4245856.1 protein kinase [Paraliomyxa miuraensis]